MIQTPPYTPPWWLPSGHLQTIFPALLRKPPMPPYQRRNLELGDGDFLDLDWWRSGNRRLVILSHGLEGHSKRAYVTGMAHMARAEGWDVLAWNFRGCGGTDNRLPRLYCNADVPDLHAVVTTAAAAGYACIVLIGFSMGGNVNLLYLGRESSALPQVVAGSINFSVPCDLAGCSSALAGPFCRLYMKRFLLDLKKKLRSKQQHYPHLVQLDGYDRIRDFRDFDNRYTAPFHGFKDATDYWKQCSCLPWLESIRVPSLVVNAANDPFLSPSCSPCSLQTPMVQVVTPAQGGHCGFPGSTPNGRYWSEQLAAEFLSGFQ